ncbi:hypothetical protein N431DRAFT_435878 [Stipitochalara longipes BDJ]|nr:hypothetical protein N431DRAFT_435878 [Stipitochalara longipes BDJ]
MGSIQEMPSLEMASKSRDVEMRDGEVEHEGEALSYATEAPSQAKRTNGISVGREEINHVSNGHLTPDHKGASNSPEENHVDQPLPSVEKDDDRSPSTAAAENEKTPEGESRGAVQSSPTKSRHQHSASVSAPSHMQTSTESIKLEKEIARLNEVLEETSAQAAQKVLHDKWRFFLFEQYDESHVSFILRAGFKNANPTVTEKVLQDKSLFKELLLDVASRKQGVIEKVLTNATSAQLLHVPLRVLDDALAERLKTVSAKQLIGWLARADRLGYKMDDIIDEDDESVVPRAESVDADLTEVFEVEPAPAPRFASSYRDPLLAEQEKNLHVQRQLVESQRIEKLKADAARQQQQQQQQRQQQQEQQRPSSQTIPPSQRLSCPDCRVVLPTMSGYNYHTTKKPCRKVPPVATSKWWCENCIQGFTTKQGMDYHKLKGVCSGEDIAPATSPSKQLRQEAASQAQYRPPPVPSSQPQIQIPSVPRPSFTAQPNQPTLPARSVRQSDFTSSTSQSQSRPEVTVQRPPLHTPASTPSMSTPGPRKQAPPSDVRQSPSELSAERLAALNRELQDADDRYEQQIAEIPPTYTEAERTARLVSLKNANASRKSQIRKAHGVSLRLREKDKLARKVAGVSPPGKAASEHRSSMTSMTSTPPSAAPTSSFSPINTPPPRTAPSSSDYGRPGNPPHPSQASAYNGPGNPPHPSQASRYTPTVPSNTPTASSSDQHSSRASYNAALNTAHKPTTAAYRPPPLNASVRVQSPYMAHDPNTLSHALERTSPRASKFNVMRVQDLASNPAPPTTNNPNKRRRSPDDEGGPVPHRTSVGPLASISSFAPNPFDHNSARQGQPQVVIGERVGDASRRAQQQASERDTSIIEAPAPKLRKPQATTIEILSSDSDSDVPPRANPLHPAIRQSALSAPPQTAPREQSEPKQNGESEKEKRNGGDITDSDSDYKTSKPSSRPGTAGSLGGGSRRGFMAKRGGKH